MQLGFWNWTEWYTAASLFCAMHFTYLSLFGWFPPRSLSTIAAQWLKWLRLNKTIKQFHLRPFRWWPNVWFFKCWRLLDFIKNQSKFVYFCVVLCHSSQAEENFGQLTIFLVRFVPNKSFDNIKLVGNALWAWALAFTFFISFEGSSYWFVYPNRGRIFLRENSNGLKVGQSIYVSVSPYFGEHKQQLLTS